MYQNLKTHFAVYVSDIPVTLKQSQRHQFWYELVDPKQGYNCAKFERLRLNSVREKANGKVFIKPGHVSTISLECAQK